jgi:hypothetical protein
MLKTLKLMHSLERLNPWHLIFLAGLIRSIFVCVFALNSNWGNTSLIYGQGIEGAGVDGYIQLARTMITSGEYAFAPGSPAVSFRPPLLPFLMAAVCAWSPDHWYWLWLAYSTVAGTVTIWVLWRCALLAGMARLPTNLLLAVTAFHPYLIFSTRVPALPTTLTLLVTLILLALIYFVKNNGSKPLALGGVWGIACLTHGAFMPLLVPFNLILFIITPGPWIRRLKGVVAASCISLVLVAPWTVRNHVAFDKFIPVATGGALQWWLGNAIYFQGDSNMLRAFDRVKNDFELKEKRPLSLIYGGILDLKDDSILANQAKEQIRTNPTIIIKRILVGTPLFWMTMDVGWKKAFIVSALNFPFIIIYLVILATAAYRRSADRIWLAGQFLLLGFWSLFALVQSVGPYFLAIIPLFLFLTVRGIEHQFPKIFFQLRNVGN